MDSVINGNIIFADICTFKFDGGLEIICLTPKRRGIMYMTKRLVDF